MDDILAKLAERFAPDAVEWRVGSTNGEKTSGLALAYIDSRAVQDRLNEVCGLNWQVRHPWAAGTKLACEIGIKIDGEWIWRGDGAGDSDVEAEKGAFSDSFKRAAVRWGIGRYLYDVKSPWVKLKPQGRSFVIDPSEFPKLRALLGGGRQEGRPAPVPDAPAAQTQQLDAASDIREKRTNDIIAAIRATHSTEELADAWKHYQGDIVAMPPDMLAAITKAKDEMKTKLTRKAA